MLEIQTLDDIALLKETVELECKLAAGRHGRGQLPDDFWPTYSAFANSRGGLVVLGVREKAGSFELEGISEVERVRTDLFNQVNNGQKVSSNLLNDKNVVECRINARSILIIEVPRASRKERPIYINSNPLTGTFRRLNDGDRQCDRETVHRMLAEQVEDSRDARILRGYTLSDLSAESVAAYRRIMRDRSPSHPYLDREGESFLRLLGAWGRDRESGNTGLTAAGLLMFGRSESIREEFPNYFLDYQERPIAKTEARWVDRVTLDGTWSGNLFDFYGRVYRKLTSDLKMPFSLQDGQRQDETAVHEALREAFVNCLVHADYTGRVSILVVKRPDLFGFRNPGLMRIPVAQALAGGESDGRNRTLQQMFLLIGAGERAGSGVPKIHKGWIDQHWRPPSLYELEEPSEQTLLELRMADLIPQETLRQLRKQFGSAFNKLDRDHRLILATAATERTVNHARISTICDQHPADLTRIFQSLVQAGFLVQTGRARGSVYHLPGSTLPSPEAVFSPPSDGIDSELGQHGSDLNAHGTDPSSEPSAGGRGKIIDGLSYRLIDNVEELEQSLGLELISITFDMKFRERVPRSEMMQCIFNLCKGRFLTLKVMAKLLARDEDYLRIRLLKPMVEKGLLLRAFPQFPNDPRQAYTAGISDESF